MSFLEDGEYELDVSILLDNPSTNNNSFNDNIAIRYGFIPDSMDQSKPLKLYQQDQTCILKATLSDSDPTPIFFEGIPQRYQINNTTSSNTNNDAYYLTFNSQNHTTNNNNNNNNKVVELKKLDSTIKFNKSRNVSKLQNQIKTMEKQYQVQQRQQLKLLKNDNNTRTPTPNPNLTISSNSSVILPPSKKSTPKTSPLRKPPKPTVTPVRKMASKRPPSATNTPEIKPKESSSEPIISESDFEDLEMDDKLTEEVPIIEFNFDNYDNDEDKKEEVVNKSNNENQNITKGMELKPKPKPKPKPSEETSKTKVKPQPRKQKKQKKPLSEETVDLTDDLDDDFKDLEDQLEELLEEEEQPKQQQIKETKSNQSIQKKPSPTIEVDPIAFNDSDESDFEDFHFTGIKIDEGNNNNSSSSNNNNKTKNISIDNGNSNEELNFNKTVLGGKPRSLRDLILGGNTPNIDDGSSSEEE